MKRVFDWKCSLYSLTVCLDSMSRFPLYLFLLSFFSHILPISGISDTSRLLDFKKNAKFISYTSAVREPETEGKEKNDVFCCCFSWKTTRSVRWGNRKYARLPLGLFWRGSAVTLQQLLWGFCTADSSSMFTTVRVGATSDCVQARGKNSIPMMAKVQFLLYITTITMNVIKYRFCMWETCVLV